MSNILLFSKTLIPPKDHYKLASHSSFLLILLLSLLHFAWFLVCGEQECLLQVCVGLLAWFVDGRRIALSSFWLSSKSGEIFPIFEEVLVNIVFLVDVFLLLIKP